MPFALSLLALALPAMGQDEEDEPPAPEAPVEDDMPPSPVTNLPPKPGTAPAETGRTYDMEIGFRGRYMDVPDSILDIWYFQNDDDATIPDRPHVSAYALGLEYVIKGKQSNGIFYAEYLNPLLEPGYWDDKEEPVNHLDGSWIEPDKFGLVLVGANYAFEAHAKPWLSFLFGAGLGVAVPVGRILEWQPGEDPSDPEGTNNNTEVDCGPAGSDQSAAYFRADLCEADSEIDIPVGALPYLDVLVGPRFTISERATLRLEGGIHTMLPYGGATLGIQF